MSNNLFLHISIYSGRLKVLNRPIKKLLFKEGGSPLYVKLCLSQCFIFSFFSTGKGQIYFYYGENSFFLYQEVISPSDSEPWRRESFSTCGLIVWLLTSGMHLLGLSFSSKLTGTCLWWSADLQDWVQRNQQVQSWCLRLQPEPYFCVKRSNLYDVILFSLEAGTS